MGLGCPPPACPGGLRCWGQGVGGRPESPSSPAVEAEAEPNTANLGLSVGASSQHREGLEVCPARYVRARGLAGNGLGAGCRLPEAQRIQEAPGICQRLKDCSRRRRREVLFLWGSAAPLASHLPHSPTVSRDQSGDMLGYVASAVRAPLSIPSFSVSFRPSGKPCPTPHPSTPPPASRKKAPSVGPVTLGPVHPGVCQGGSGKGTRLRVTS